MDWKTLITEIQERGYSQAEIGREINNRAQSWVADIIKGRYDDLRWQDGQALIALHKRVTRQKVAS